MCHSLNFAKRSELITEDEKRSCINAIHKYLTKMYSHAEMDLPFYPELKKALDINELPCKFENTKAVYLNWKKRPKPWKKQ